MKFEYIKDIDTNIPIPESYSDCIRLIKSDAYRHCGRKKSFATIFFESFSRISVDFSIWFRLSQYKGLLYPFAKFMLHRYKKKYGIFIPAKVKIGYGLYIQRCFGIIINSHAVIGNNVNIGQLTTIGSNQPQAAHIGDEVYIGPGCNIVDDIAVNSRTCIGAGAVVTRDLPCDVTAAGVPAKILHNGGHPEYIRNPWPKEWMV